MGSNYKDSYFQFQHLAQSQSVLYREWMADEPLPTPDQILRAAGPGGRGAMDAGGSQGGSVPPGQGSGDLPRDLGPSTVVSDKFWDFFEDDEQWETFTPANMTLESNGNLIYSKVVSASRDTNIADARTRQGGGAEGQDSDTEAPERDVIVGSIFDPRTLGKIRARVSGWDDVRVSSLR